MGGHLSGGCSDVDEHEWTRLTQVWKDGQEISGVLASLHLLGCMRFVGLQEQLDMTESEFEPLVLCFVASRRTTGKKLREVAWWATSNSKESLAQ